MWAVPYVSPPNPRVHVNVIPKPATTRHNPLSVAISASKPSAIVVGGSGRTILTALKSNSNPKPKPTNPNIPIPQKQKPKQEVEAKQVSRSDVLWALQQAAAKKKASGKNRNEKKSSTSSRGLSSRAGRALSVKSEWSGKLDELKKRLEEISHTK